MKLTVERFKFLETCTIGKLFIDGVDAGIFTLEDKCREVTGQPVASWKVPGATAIPVGTYKVIIDFSEHFQKDFPHILNVPGFDGIRIHAGNSDLDTDGCILVGKTWAGGDFVGNSRDAYLGLFAKIRATDNITMEITGTPVQPVVTV